jgi:glycine oxidase
METTEFIIVGQGLAGSLVAYELQKAGKSFIVIDEQKENTSSKICGGMFTPISGKRMTKSKDTDELLGLAKKMYLEIETYLGIKILNEKNIYTVFGSVKEQNDLTLKLDNQNFSQHINLQPENQESIKQPFGSFEIEGSGWIDVKKFLSSMKQKLEETNQYRTEKFDYSLLKKVDEKWQYKKIVATNIIFCEGVNATQNPFFPNLPFRFCKGDMLTIKCELLKTNRVIKKGIGILHLHDDIFKVGSNYEWNDLSEAPTEAGKNMLLKKLDELIDVPYTIIKHEAAIRPSSITREPFIKIHPEHKNMFMLNGLGTKGVMTGPRLVKEMILQMV